MLSELERIERRQIAIEALLRQVLQSNQKVLEQQAQLVALLQPPTDYPQSTGGTVTVTG